MGSVLLRLRGGQLIGTPLPELSQGLVGDFFNSTAQQLYDNSIEKLGLQRYDPEDDTDTHPFHIYFHVVSRILHIIGEQRHGGTLVFVPEDFEATDGRLLDRLKLKYKLNKPSIWNVLIDETVSRKQYYSAMFPQRGRYLLNHPKATAKQLKTLLHSENWLNNCKKKLEEYAYFVASLAAVDGAVVLTKKLDTLGFGAEITVTSPSLTTLKQALDPSGVKSQMFDISAFGTRHRSAARLCSSFEECLAFVVSQDGPVKAIKRHKSEVLMWNDVNIGYSSV